MSAMDRIREKALHARGVVPRIIAGVESDLDSVIAAEADLDKQRGAAFAPHFAALAETKMELEGIKDALNIMSNGGPPLQESGAVAPVSSILEPAPSPLAVGGVPPQAVNSLPQQMGQQAAANSLYPAS